MLDIGSYFDKDVSLIATITDLEESPEPLLLFHKYVHILCHLYNTFTYSLYHCCNF